MSIVFKLKDIIHNVAVKFFPASLPGAKKPYNIKPAHQTELDINGVAAKAEVYKIRTDPSVIIEGFNTAVELMFYLAADGYKIKTLLFTLWLKFRGEYDGTETRLADGIKPEVRLVRSPEIMDYVGEKVHVEFDGFFNNEGCIAGVEDAATELVNECATIGDILVIRGAGLKIEAEEKNKEASGVYFVPVDGGTTVKAKRISVNEPRLLHVLVPALTKGNAYYVMVCTWGSAKGGGTICKRKREMKSDFAVTAQK